MLVSANGKGTFRVGNRVPYATGAFQASTGANPLQVNTQYQYFDVGVNIDCWIREGAGKVNVRADLDVSTVVQHDRSGAAGTAPNPTISQIKMNVDAMVNPGKPTVVASIDDPVTMRKFDVDVTVTKMN
jgi:type II secretory pathway component GspD/PulD (secretin)